MSPVFKKRILLELLSAVGIVSATGCYSAAPAAIAPQSMNADGAGHQRLIIKLKSNSLNCNADGIAKLSAATRVSLVFVSTISGESCVITQFADSTEGLIHGQEVLRQHPAVEWLEQDRKMKALMQK